MTSKLKELAKGAMDYVRYSPARLKVNDCTKNSGYGPSTSDKQEIAQATFDYDQCKDIMQAVWKRLDQKPKKYRSIQRMLQVLNYILLHGSNTVSQELKFEIHRVQRLQQFYFSDNGREMGTGVRNAAKEILDLLRDEEELDKKRDNAKDNGFDKYRGVSSTQSRWNRSTSSSDNNYGYSSGSKGAFDRNPNVPAYSSSAYKPPGPSRPTIGRSSTSSPKKIAAISDDEDTNDGSNITFRKKKKKKKNRDSKKPTPSKLVRKLSGENLSDQGISKRPKSPKKPIIEPKQKPVVVQQQEPSILNFFDTPQVNNNFAASRIPPSSTNNFFSTTATTTTTKPTNSFEDSDTWDIQDGEWGNDGKKKQKTNADSFFDPVVPHQKKQQTINISSGNVMNETGEGFDELFEKDDFDMETATPKPEKEEGGDEILSFFKGTELFAKPTTTTDTASPLNQSKDKKMTIHQMKGIGNRGRRRPTKSTLSTTTIIPPQPQYPQNYYSPPPPNQHIVPQNYQNYNIPQRNYSNPNPNMNMNMNMNPNINMNPNYNMNPNINRTNPFYN